MDNSIAASIEPIIPTPNKMPRSAMLAAGGLSLAFLVAGVAMALHYSTSNKAPGESGLAAINFLRTGTIGNPYLIPTGPTAHVSPVLVFYLAGLFQLFGLNTPAARMACSIIAAMAYAGSCFVTLQICSRDKLLFWVAFSLLVVSPLFLFTDCVGARQWDQPFTSLILVLAWWMTTTINPSRNIRPVVLMAVLSGLGILLSPGMIPTLLLALALIIWRSRRLTPVYIS